MSFSYFNYLGKLADSGVLGVLLALCIFAIIYLFNKVNRQQEDALDEKEKMIIILKSSNETLENALGKEKFLAHLVTDEKEKNCK